MVTTSSSTNAALRLRSLTAWKWASLGELLSRAVSPITLIVLTRLLTPRDYGVFVGALLVVAFGQILVESGVARALIQKKDDIQRIASSAFTLVMGVGVALSALLWALATPISVVLIGDSAGKAVIAILGLQIPIAAAGAIHRALLERELRFRPIFVGRLVSVLVTATTSISLATHGAEEWALVCGALAGMTCEVAVLWVTSGFRPQLRLSRWELASVRSFSAWTLGQDVLAWLILYADALIVAAFLNVEQLGKYRLGTILVTGAFAAVFVPAERVLFSLFSKYPDAAAVGRTLSHLILLGVLVALPVGLVLFASHRELEATLFPSRWSGMGFVIGIVGLREAVANTAFAVDAAYKGVGRPDIIFKVRTVNLVVLLTLQMIALQFGFELFLIARLVGTITALGLILIVARRFFGTGHVAWTREYQLAIALLVLAAVSALGVSLITDGAVAPLLAVFTLLIPFGIVAGRVVRSIVTTQL